MASNKRRICSLRSSTSLGEVSFASNKSSIRKHESSSSRTDIGPAPWDFKRFTLRTASRKLCRRAVCSHDAN
jgi:hypothetical protein